LGQLFESLSHLRLLVGGEGVEPHAIKNRVTAGQPPTQLTPPIHNNLDQAVNSLLILFCPQHEKGRQVSQAASKLFVSLEF